MLTTHAKARIFLYDKSVDMRKSFEGLSKIVESLGEEVTSGGYFLFLNRRQDRMKILYWDVDGLALWYKRLEKGSFLRTESGEMQMNRREFLMLLEGVTPKRLNCRYNLS